MKFFITVFKTDELVCIDHCILSFSQAANNIVVLAKEKAGAELILKENGIAKLLAAKKIEKNEEISLAVIRTFSELCKNNVDRVSIIIII